MFLRLQNLTKTPIEAIEAMTTKRQYPTNSKNISISKVITTALILEINRSSLLVCEITSNFLKQIMFNQENHDPGRLDLFLGTSFLGTEAKLFR